nr:pilus assembly protein PilB [Desulfuromonadales bacterium]NIR34152.1 pilus assembly protein PilB [Desulfuromonadales bacterium]NIS40235.1 pilus assembly protein PilB [Desulfuromonadales bacterium]
VSSLNCVLAQRLVRKICSKCKVEVEYDRQTLVEGGLDPDACRDATFYEGKGCEECHGIGYQGRSAIVELLDMDDRMRQLIMDRAPISQLKQEAQQAGMVFLRESAVEKVFNGVTTLKEINRVTFVEKVDSV